MEQGINFLDLFASDPVQRDNISVAIAGKREEIIIQGHTGSAWQNGQYLRTRDVPLSRAAFEGLLMRLGTDYIDIGMIHYVDGMGDWDSIQNGPLMQYALELQGYIGRFRP